MNCVDKVDSVKSYRSALNWTGKWSVCLWHCSLYNMLCCIHNFHINPSAKMQLHYVCRDYLVHVERSLCLCIVILACTAKLLLHSSCHLGVFSTWRQDQPTWFFCLLRWSLCQIRQSSSNNLLLWLGQETWHSPISLGITFILDDFVQCQQSLSMQEVVCLLCSKPEGKGVAVRV